MYADGRFARHPRFRYFALNTEMRWRALQAGRIYVRQHPHDAQLFFFDCVNMPVITQVCTHAHAHAHAHARTHACTHAHTHTNMHTHTHVHTHARVYHCSSITSTETQRHVRSGSPPPMPCISSSYNWASVSEPHTSDFNATFSLYIYVICICDRHCTSKIAINISIFHLGSYTRRARIVPRSGAVGPTHFRSHCPRPPGAEL